VSFGAIQATLSPPGRNLAIRYLVVASAANLVWEVAQLPLYTIWTTATTGGLAFAVLHCVGGDALILLVTLSVSLLLLGDVAWPSRGYGRVVFAASLLGVSFAIFSEWLNVQVWATWAYAPAMPVIPPLGTGLSPLMQWVVIPPLVLQLIRPSGSSPARGRRHAPPERSKHRSRGNRHRTHDPDQGLQYPKH
jgi:hypothetical protein